MAHPNTKSFWLAATNTASRAKDSSRNDENMLAKPAAMFTLVPSLRALSKRNAGNVHPIRPTKAPAAIVGS